MYGEGRFAKAKMAIASEASVHSINCERKIKVSNRAMEVVVCQIKVVS